MSNSKLAYDKPVLRKIALVGEGVLGSGCKSSPSGNGEAMPTACGIPIQPCVGTGS